MKLTTTILFFAVWTMNLFGQKIRPEIAMIADSIAMDNVLKSRGTGIGGTVTEQWERFVSLKTNATDKELIALTNHENAVVRCYSFNALALRKNREVFPIVVKHLSDTAVVQTFFGCIRSSEMTGDYFLDVVTPEYADSDSYKLTETQIEKIDNILIFDKQILLSARSEVLQELKPLPKYYIRIREMVIDEKDNVALITLSRYQKQQDRELIIERLTSGKTNIQYYGLEAVKFFPDSVFFSYLKDIHSVEIRKPTGFDFRMLRSLYLAIVKYQDMQSKELLELTLNNSKESTLKYHSEFIWLALQLYPSSIYNGIQERINLSNSQKSDLHYWIDNEHR